MKPLVLHDTCNRVFVNSTPEILWTISYYFDIETVYPKFFKGATGPESAFATEVFN